MNLGFLSPLAGLVALAVLAPLFLLAAAERRGSRARTLLGLDAPGPAARLEMPVAICILGAFLGLAAAQPVLHREVPRYARHDAEAIVAFDISRSMLATPTRTAPSRLERAKAIATRLRAELADTPVGVASFTDRVLPHLFPTSDSSAFSATVTRAIGVEHPPPIGNNVTATGLDVLGDVVRMGYFTPGIAHRLLIVLTDGESRDFNPEAVRRAFSGRPPVKVIVVRVGSHDERVFGPDGLPEPAYPPPQPENGLARFLAAARGRVFDDRHLGAAVHAAREDLGSGPRARLGTAAATTDLAPFLVLAAALPLGLVLRRRNGTG
jgi:hypothetical protein